MILGAKPWQGLKRQLQQLPSPWLFGGGAALLAPHSFQIAITAAARRARSIPGAITDLFNKTPRRGRCFSWPPPPPQLPQFPPPHFVGIEERRWGPSSVHGRWAHQGLIDGRILLTFEGRQERLRTWNPPAA